jgi:hypothetical protein
MQQSLEDTGVRFQLHAPLKIICQCQKDRNIFGQHVLLSEYISLGLITKSYKHNNSPILHNFHPGTFSFLLFLKVPVKSSKTNFVNFIKIPLHKSPKSYSVNFIKVPLGRRSLNKSPRPSSINLIKILLARAREPLHKSPEPCAIYFIKVPFEIWRALDKGPKSSAVNFVKIPFLLAKSIPTRTKD